MSDVTYIETKPEKLWREFLEAREVAFKSKAIGDGIIAGRKWAAFLNEFVPAHHKSKLGEVP